MISNTTVIPVLLQSLVSFREQKHVKCDLRNPIPTKSRFQSRDWILFMPVRAGYVTGELSVRLYQHHISC